VMSDSYCDPVKAGQLLTTKLIWLSIELPSPAPAFPNYTLFESSGNAFETLSKAPLPGNSGQSSVVTSSGSMVSSDIRAIFSQSPAPGFPPLASSPPRWPDQHLRHAVSLSGSSSGITTTSASNPSLSSGQTSGLYHPGNQSPSYNRPTFMPIDPWATSGNQHSLQQQPIASGYPGTIGQTRTPPSGLNIPSGSGFYTTNNHSQQSQLFSPEGPYGSTMGYSTGPSSSNYVYSNNNSPVQDLSSNIAHFSSTVGPQHQQDYHPLPQRPHSGSFISRENLQFLEDKGMSGPAFGPGYGPSLNSGNTRSHQQAMHHQAASQPYSLQSAFGQPIQYPQQRQRHSSHNSNASHHTMFLGPVDGSLGSAGGSVNSDISTEDDSDDPLDDMRFRHHSYQYQYQGGQGGLGSQVPSQSILANRRGSVPSMGSMHSNQQLYSDIPHPSAPTSNVVRLSNSSSDLHSRKSLANAMSRLSMEAHQTPALDLVGPLEGSEEAPQGSLARAQVRSSMSGIWFLVVSVELSAVEQSVMAPSALLLIPMLVKCVVSTVKPQVTRVSVTRTTLARRSPHPRNPFLPRIALDSTLEAGIVKKGKGSRQGVMVINTRVQNSCHFAVV